MAKGSSYSRRQRRGELRAAGFLKIKNMYSRLSPKALAWYNKMQADGNAAYDANEKARLDSIEEQLESKLKSLKETWTAMGYNAEEVSKLEEAWSLTAIKDSESYRADKKQANILQKEASSSLKARINAGS